MVMAERKARAFGWITRLCALLFLFLSILGWLRFEQAILNWHILVEFRAYPGPVYIAGGGLLWGLAGLAPAWGLWSHRPWGFRLARLVAPMYPLTYWIDKLAFNYDPQGLQNWPFALALTLIYFGLIYLGMPIRRKERHNEQGNEHEQR